jgi:hypothetical protein
MSQPLPPDASLVSPDGRYRFVVETDPRIDERLLPRLRLEAAATGEVLFDAHSTTLLKAPAFGEAGRVVLEVEHAGQPFVVEIALAERTYRVCEPHAFPEPLAGLPADLAERAFRPRVAAPARGIVRAGIWLVLLAVFTGLFIAIPILRTPRTGDWWWIALGVVFGGFGTWGCFCEVRELLRRRRK